MTTREGVDLAGQPLTVLEGVGPARAARLARLGLTSVRDLIVCVPRGLERQGDEESVAAALERVGEDVSLRGTLSGARIFRRGRRRSTVSVDLSDDTGKLRVLFFNQPWLFEKLRAWVDEQRTVELYGRVVETKSGPALSSPRVASEARPLPAPGTILPVYPGTEGISQDYLRGLAFRATERYATELDDPLDAEELAGLGLPDLARAVRELHRPPTEEAFLRARRRLALERLLVLQAALRDARERAAGGRARAIRATPTERAALVDALPLVPTGGQRKVMAEIADDLERTRPMRRLLQGDVGSGKTLVALHAIASAARAGGQAALLAPTELLAEQHHRALAGWLADAGLRAELLTGSVPAGERREREALLASGSAELVIGTHALFSEGVRFGRLDLVVVDEQQRFGVEQKRSLVEKGRDVHVLLLSATPIPRTLALTLYGDLDVSALEEKPAGRGELATRFVPPKKRQAMLGFLAERMRAEERVFWVCPRIDEDEASETAAAEATYRALSGGDLAGFGVELVHGRIAPEERACRLARFRGGEARLLVGTSIVEVGLDVPEATVMVIEGAERFGLAQLHQLRGRVGRGPRPSWCLLLASDGARKRLAILAETNDGFRIAEEDLRQRGMGDLAGLRQAGRNIEGLDDPFADLELVRLARRLVGDPALFRRYLAHAPAPALV